MSSKRNRERLVKALEEARRVEKKLLEDEARETDAETERIVERIHRPLPADSAGTEPLR